MADPGRAKDVNEAAARFAQTLAESYRLVYGQATGSAERQRRRAREFSELVGSNLREQAEAGRSDARELSEQAARQREAGQELARESVEAYARFLDEAFSRYRAGAERATQGAREGAREGARTLTETTAGVVGTATGAAAATAGAAAFPIAGYEEMNVEEVSRRLDELSVEELQVVRDHEERTKRRETLLERMDRKIRAS